MTSSSVSQVPAASPEAARAHFANRLSLETDCADVHEATSGADGGAADFVLSRIVRGPLGSTPARSVPGAINLPHRQITAERMRRLAGRHFVRGLLRRPALQRRRPRRAAIGGTQAPGEADARRHDRLGGRGLCIRERRCARERICCRSNSREGHGLFISWPGGSD